MGKKEQEGIREHPALENAIDGEHSPSTADNTRTRSLILIIRIKTAFGSGL